MPASRVLCREFVDAFGHRHQGAGLLDVQMDWQSRADGPVITKANPSLGLPPLSGYEFHHGRAQRGPNARPFVELDLGVGDGNQSPSDGAIQGQVIGSWLHGPLLPRNPAVADLLLRWVRPELFDAATTAPDDSLADAVRATRVAQARLTE